VQSVAYHAGQAKLITGASDGRVTIQSIEQTQKDPLVRVVGLEYGRRGIDFSPITDAIVVGNRGELRMVDRTGTDLKWPAINSAAVGFSPDGVLLAVAESPHQQSQLPNQDRSITRIWDVNRRRSLCTIPGVLNCFSSDSKNVFVTVRKGDGWSVQQWSIATTQTPSLIRTFENYWHAMMIPGRRWLALIRPENNTIQLLDLNDASLVKSPVFKSTITSGCVFPRQQGAAIATDDGAIHILDSSCEREVATLTGHGGPIWSLDVSPDGSTLASGSDDGTVKLWHLNSRSHLFTLTDHGSAVVQVRFSHDGTVLATGSVDGTVRLRSADARIGPHGSLN
jgi:WD40 repeat protein